MMETRVHPQPAPGGGGQQSRCCHFQAAEDQKRKVGYTSLLLLSLAVFGAFGAVSVLDSRQPLYSVAVTSVSGLDPAADLGRARLDPQFDLTLRIVSRSPMSSACLKPGTVLEVSYQGVRLAGVPVQRLCARPMRAAEQRRDAWGSVVRVPGNVLDSLAGDLRRGEAAFDVTITGHGMVLQCTGRRLGDDGALRAPCQLTDLDLGLPA